MFCPTICMYSALAIHEKSEFHVCRCFVLASCAFCRLLCFNLLRSIAQLWRTAYSHLVSKVWYDKVYIEFWLRLRSDNKDPVFLHNRLSRARYPMKMLCQPNCLLMLLVSACILKESSATCIYGVSSDVCEMVP
jgi:hypothetical protein